MFTTTTIRNSELFQNTLFKITKNEHLLFSKVQVIYQIFKKSVEIGDYLQNPTLYFFKNSYSFQTFFDISFIIIIDLFLNKNSKTKHLELLLNKVINNTCY